MKKEVVSKPQNNDFLNFIKENLEIEANRKSWIYIDQLTIDYLGGIQGFPYMDTDAKLHIPYGNIIIEGYRDDYAWYRIASINSDTVCYNAVADPDHIFFITSKV